MRTVCLLIAAFMAAAAAASDESAARGVIGRLIGGRVESFEFIKVAKTGVLDSFSVSADHGKVTVQGTSGVAMCRGAYEYLREKCGVLVTWEGNRVVLPPRLPDYAKRTVVCPNQYRHYFNVCTFGYTMAFWDWARWEREIDWMAFHGINMPLAMTGQEAVWQKTFRAFGISDHDIRAFLTGPAFLPWHWMGNVDSHMGPLPQSFIDKHAELQKRILKRERELGMTPVTPAFAGFVPKQFVSSNMGRSSGWAGFEPTYQLSPNDPMFRAVGKRFVEEYRRMYGSDHLYLADVYNEMTPQLSTRDVFGELAACGQGIYNAIAAGDPEGIWVMQGWLFLNERSFWTKPYVEAYLSGVPASKLITLDLSCEAMEVWREHQAVRDKGWIFNFLHNFGGNTGQYGDPERYLATWSKMIADKNKGRMLGMGLTMEGIEQNSWWYELATDLMWRAEPLSWHQWVADWCDWRYGRVAKDVVDAWEEMPHSAYPGGSGYASRTTLAEVGEPSNEIEKDKSRLASLLSKKLELGASQLYQHDVVDFAKRYLARVFDTKRFIAAQRFGTVGYAQAVEESMHVLDEIDQLVASQPERRLARWVSNARKWGTTAAEKDLMEKNARAQVTVWGGPVLNDYAAKEWSGLIHDFYKVRMKMAFDGKSAQQIADWEWKWIDDKAPITQRGPQPPVEFASRLLEKYKNLSVTIDRGIAVGKTATDSGHTEPGGLASNAVDGSAGGAYWAASPFPQWWQVDLGGPTTIREVQVFTYWGDGRYYRYTVEGSVDGRNWTGIGDFSQNTKPATQSGDRFVIAPMLARYIKVNMLFNSANIGVHLREVRIFAGK